MEFDDDWKRAARSECERPEGYDRQQAVYAQGDELLEQYTWDIAATIPLSYSIAKSWVCQPSDIHQAFAEVSGFSTANPGRLAEEYEMELVRLCMADIKGEVCQIAASEINSQTSIRRICFRATVRFLNYLLDGK